MGKNQHSICRSHHNNRMPSYCNLDRLMMTFEHFSIQQIAEQLNLSLPILLNELSQTQINITDSHRTLRENFPLNDEKFSPQLQLP